MTEYQIGDEVEIVKNLQEPEFDMVVGARGTVVEITPAYILVTLDHDAVWADDDFLCLPEEIRLTGRNNHK